MRQLESEGRLMYREPYTESDDMKVWFSMSEVDLSDSQLPAGALSPEATPPLSM